MYQAKIDQLLCGCVDPPAFPRQHAKIRTYAAPLVSANSRPLSKGAVSIGRHFRDHSLRLAFDLDHKSPAAIPQRRALLPSVMFLKDMI